MNTIDFFMIERIALLKFMILNLPHCLLMYAYLQGPYDTSLHGCAGLDRRNVLRSLVVSANYLPNASFTQQLSETVTFSSYLGRAVSVQTSPDATLGCGRFETLFPVDASYQGGHILSQLFQYLPASLPDLSKFDIPPFIILDGIAKTCSSEAAVFDPWSPGPRVGSKVTNDQNPVGDLPNHILLVFSFVPDVPLIGSATILGHAVSGISYLATV